MKRLFGIATLVALVLGTVAAAYAWYPGRYCGWGRGMGYGMGYGAFYPAMA